MYLACQGLWVRSGNTDVAIVGAPNPVLSPELNIALSNISFLSTEGKCFSFDHRASGYARGEGFTALVLKPLSKALAAGDNIRALDTYQRAGLDMNVTRYFEAQGTGTAVGDPIEAHAIGKSFRNHRSDTKPLYVGAVKSNIGHLGGC
ncbi:thiolase-like protein [Bimuria novae-zelandiae CBS 107.79]|uniref:Thiolase-like protein n=1 Tax=Bimuria novae-zelandiae CBS 107.79 TaxID=1447943 RepID=A0A6A5V4N2_9PLEO|nr:thiolase-like protein [Bimuria novae-zelandiae CBS 107.79]